MCGLLGKSLYGTRDAAQNWAASYVGFMEEIGFERGKSSPCCFYNKKYKIRCVVHGDDFAVLGKRENLDWFRAKIQDKYPVKFREEWVQEMVMTKASGYSTESSRGTAKVSIGKGISDMLRFW